MSLLLDKLTLLDTAPRIGKVIEAMGTMVKVSGVDANVGDLCELFDRNSSYSLKAEVVGLRDSYTLLTPLGGLTGINTAMEVRVLKQASSVPVGPELLGRIIDALGNPLDDLGPLTCQATTALLRDTPNPLSRLPVAKVFKTGIRAVDGLLTVGLGQRVGIFASAGGGKSTLLGMLARGSEAEIKIIVLVGERGREVLEFIEDSLDKETRKNSVLIVATSDRPAMERCRAALLGTAIAEYFRDQGKTVLLMMDSITRYARALREIGLAMGEPPARRGFPPSVFANLPMLVERAGNNDKGHITAFYTVLLEDEQEGEDPVGEEIRSLLDGHMILSRKLSERSHYPAIDVLKSASRVMTRIVNKEHVSAAQKFKELLAKFNDIELLLQIGEFQKGADALADQAIDSIEELNDFLRQDSGYQETFDETQSRLKSLV